MLSKFSDHIEGQNINPSSSRFLLAVSGGLDSMCMLDLFISQKYTIGVAHINHNLRADESDQDQQFLKEYCKEKNIPFYVYAIDPSLFASDNMHKIARQERYTFLNKIRTKHNYDYICTAHHRDDSVETFLFNFSRGSGLRGLCGIQSNKEKYLRPIIDCSRAEIHDYVLNNNIPFREDSSNSSPHYTRNKIRRQVIPAIKEVFPAFSITAKVSMNNLKDSNLLLDEFITQWAAKHCLNVNDEYRISKAAIQDSKGSLTLLYNLIHRYGFNRSQIKDALHSINSVGSIIYSTDYKLLIDRQNFIIRSNTSVQKQVILHIEEVKEFKLSNDPFVEIIDAKNLELPLKVKSISPGVKMQPLGMKGLSKKVSDILVDKKISRFEKEDIMMVYSGATPVWLVGITIDERFKVKDNCKSMLKITYRTKV